MDFNNLDEIKRGGFTGFKKMSELFYDTSSIPDTRGVYLVLNLIEGEPEFLPIGTGGFFKGKNPNISLEELKANWVQNVKVVYIGKAGGSNSNATLKSRLKQYFGFGQGKNIGHYGGRLIWQLKNSNDLILCWKTLPNEEPRIVETNLLRDFVLELKQRPFANLAD
jgi:hypothetical protein